MTDSSFTQAEPAQPYGAPYSSAPTPKHVNPGFALGIVGFVLSFFGVLDIAGLIISIIALAKSKRAGQGNGLALAGIIIASVGILATALVLAVAVPTLIHAGQECARLGTGVHQIGNSVYTCTPTSFNVSTGG